MVFVVPCSPNGRSGWSQISALDGADYRLTFDWNQRTGRWTLDLADANDVPIRCGMMLATNAILLAGVLAPGRPPGELVVIDTTEKNDLDPGFADLGERFALVYLDAAEFV